jgi:Protein of unknown function (DUF1236)
MKKVLLATTCAAALSGFAWMSDVSFAQQSTGGGATQQNQNMGRATDQQDQRKAAPSSQETRPGAMSGATNENHEQTPRTNSAEQRENAQPGKAEGTMERRTPTTAQGKQPTENNHTQSGQANERERMHNGAANANETKPGTERSQTGENAQQRPNEGRAAAETQKGAAPAGTGRNEMGQRLDPKQAADFRSRLEKHGDIARVSVDFNARIGVAVPDSVRLAPLPTDIVAEYPEFRGYDVAIVRDEVVIVDPHTRNVVEVIREGGTNAAEAGPRRERLRLSREQDEVIRRNVRIEHPADVEFDERIDERVPDSVTLVPMPPPVVADIPEVRSYDYFVDRSDHVVIVDPETHEVVGVVEQ